MALGGEFCLLNRLAGCIGCCHSGGLRCLFGSGGLLLNLNQSSLRGLTLPLLCQCTLI